MSDDGSTHDLNNLSVCGCNSETTHDSPKAEKQVHFDDTRSKTSSTTKNDLSTVENSAQSSHVEASTQTLSLPSNEELPQKWSLREAVSFEDSIEILKQSSLPFFIAGLGSIGAGQVLSFASKTQLFRTTPALLALSTPLMGLKGNLDMTYASRLTTLAHLGALRTLADVWKRLPVFISTVQTQAIIMAVFSSLITFVFIWFKGKVLGIDDIMDDSLSYLPLIVSSSLLTVCASAGLMCCLTTMLVFLARKCRFNPDNVTVPLAASIGDLCCVSLLFGITLLLSLTYADSTCAIYVVVIFFLILLPCWALFSWRDESARRTLKFCWVSLIVSSLLQCSAGTILDIMARRYPDCTLYQPILSGIGGNRVAVFASKISSFLHSKGDLKTGTLPKGNSLCSHLNPFRFFYSCDNDAKCGRVLILGSFPYQLVFIFIAYVMALLCKSTDVRPKFEWAFVIGYMIFAFIQVSCLMVWGQLTCYLMWRMRIDPDIHSIPLLTGLGDLQGTFLLYVLFAFISVTFPEMINITTNTDTTIASTTATTILSALNSTI